MLLAQLFHMKVWVRVARPPTFIELERNSSQASATEISSSVSTMDEQMTTSRSPLLLLDESDQTITSSHSLQSTPPVIHAVTSHHATTTQEEPPRRLCTRHEIQHGEWVAITLSRIPYVPLRPCPSHRHKHYNTSLPWSTWEWQPFAAQAGNCTFVQWNATQFCALAKFATVAIVGDSLSWEQYVSLSLLLNKNFQLHHLGNETHIDYVCDGQVRLVYRRSLELNYELIDVINTRAPNVLILNRGAHFVTDDILEPELQHLTKQMLLPWQRSCPMTTTTLQPRRPCRLLMVRTTVPGHPYCWNFTRPAKSIREMEDHIDKLSLYEKVKSHMTNWREFKRQNELTLRVYKQSNLTLDVLDAYHINILRPDDHVAVRRNDCLHSCYPGKMDVYNQLLLHFLQMRGGVAMERAEWSVNEAIASR